MEVNSLHSIWATTIQTPFQLHQGRLPLRVQSLQPVQSSMLLTRVSIVRVVSDQVRQMRSVFVPSFHKGCSNLKQSFETVTLTWSGLGWEMQRSCVPYSIPNSPSIHRSHHCDIQVPSHYANSYFLHSLEVYTHV